MNLKFTVLWDPILIYLAMKLHHVNESSIREHTCHVELCNPHTNSTILPIIFVSFFLDITELGIWAHCPWRVANLTSAIYSSKLNWANMVSLEKIPPVFHPEFLSNSLHYPHHHCLQLAFSERHLESPIIKSYLLALAITLVVLLALVYFQRTST